MITEVLITFGIAAAAGVSYLRVKRLGLYSRLEAQINGIKSNLRIDMGDLLQRPAPAFDHRLIQLSNVLPEATIATLRAQALSLVRPERSYIPAHKKGGTVAYETLFETAPALVSLYHSREMRGLVSRIVGEDVRPTPIHDQSSLSVLFYDKPGDHIGWHYDHNFYRGRHFTVLLPIINEGSAEGGLSHATLMAQLGGGEVAIRTPPNTLVLFEGARVNHRVTPIIAGERRMVISMTYCTDPRANFLQGAVRRIKDVAFFGPRALWT